MIPELLAPPHFAAFPARPASVGEWEELLVRLEIAPRAIRNALEELPEGSPAPGEALLGLLSMEAMAGEWLRAVQQGLPGVPEHAISAVWPADEADPAGAVLREFTQRRARNFAAVQRRGLGVWDWALDDPAYGRVAAYQLLAALARSDARILAAIREEAACSPLG